MNWNNIPSRAFMKLYKKTSSQNQQRIIYLLDKINCLPLSIKQRINYRGVFKVTVSPSTRFKLINYGGLIEEQIFKHGLFKTWEKDVGWIWKELCLHSEVILDIGANRGFYSLVAKSINPNSTIYAFEPSVNHFEKLKKNIEINNFDINYSQLAISNQAIEQVFYDLPDANRNTASLSPDKMKNLPGYNGGIIEYSVRTTSLSDFIEENHINKIDLIKLDIELHEPEAIEGFGEYLTRFKPVIIIEVLTKEVADRLNRLIDFSEFLVFHLKEMKATKLEKFILSEDANSKWEWNFILFHKSLEDKMRMNTTLLMSE